MHIPDGFVRPEIHLAAGVLSAGAVALALRRARGSLDERQVPLLGVTAAFVFAAQMVNFPVAGGTSGHFLGATLAALLLGPLNAVLIMALVLTLQCLAFADGGLTALGTNIFNLGLLAGAGGYGVFRAARFFLPSSPRRFLFAAALGAWCSVVLAAAACAVELAASGVAPLAQVLSAMVLVHAVIGVGEALITVAILRTILAVRQDLIPAPIRPQEIAP